MATDLLRLREQALEYEFFHKVDEELWRQLRARMECDKRRRLLADATGITDEAVLEELVEAEISCETLYALSLFPLVWVAWSDGSISREQRKSILEAAQAAGHETDTASYQLIEKWLDQEPGKKLQTAWKDYVAAICESISADARRSLREDVLRRSRQIADIVTGRYGFQAAEHAQDVVMQEIEQAFGRD